MIDAAIEQELSNYLSQLPVEQQRQVLEFARTLTPPHIQGVPGKSLLQFAGTIEKSDLDTMSKAIENGCG